MSKLSFAERVAQKITANVFTVRTIRSVMDALKIDFRSAVTLLKDKTLLFLQRRTDFDDNWLAFAEIPTDESFGERWEEVETLNYTACVKGYEVGYLHGFMDRENLLSECIAERMNDDAET